MLCQSSLLRRLRSDLLNPKFGRYKTSEIIVMDQVQKYMDGPRLLRMRLTELVPLVRVELHS